MGHDFGEWVIVKQPTETEKGLKERTCKICNLKETEEIPVIGKPEDPKPEDPKPGTSKPGTSKPGSGKKTENTTTLRKTVKSVKTGDTTGLGMAVGAMAMALAAGAGVMIKRKKRS